LMADGLDSRKRIQKTVHLLQVAGCSLEVHFRLHYYGPYSADLADLLDRMTRSGILEETPQAVQVGTQYRYRFSEAMRQSFESYEATSRGQTAKAKMEKYQPLLKELCMTRPRVLELASTIAFYRQGKCVWENAAARTADFKNEAADSPTMTKALELAKRVFPSDDG